jgi:hypothetical protein
MGIPCLLDRWDGFDEKQEYYDAMRDYIESHPGWIHDMQPLPGALEGLAELRALFPAVCAVTSPYYTSGRWMVERYAALNQRFGFDHDDIYMGRGKHRIPARVVIEDKPLTAFRYVKRHKAPVILLRHAWTVREIEHYQIRIKLSGSKGFVIVVDNWAQILETVRTLHKL